MVGRTSPLGSLKKGILPQIHHPLPLNRRESQQLLNSITSSFRKNLDKEHPWHAENAAEPASKTKRDQSLVRSKDTIPIIPGYRPRPTERHLESILSNPLFANPQNATQRASNAVRSDSIAVFDTAVAKGMMTTRRAAGYLGIVRQELSRSTLNMQEGMADSGAGLRVVQWLRASGAENTLEFLSDASLMQNLIQFMFAEGLEEVAWTWLARLGSRLGKLPQDLQTQRLLTSLLQAIVKTQQFMARETSSSLDHSYSAFLRANQTIPLQDPAALLNLKRYWNYLSWTSTVNAIAHPKPSAPLYEMFIDVGRPWKKDLDIAHLELHHPTKPDHVPAVRYLHDDKTVATAVELQAKSDRYTKRMVSLGGDTVKRLKEVGQNEEASWVTEFMSRTFFFAWNIRGDKAGTDMMLESKRGLAGWT